MYEAPTQAPLLFLFGCYHCKQLSELRVCLLIHLRICRTPKGARSPEAMTQTIVESEAQVLSPSHRVILSVCHISSSHFMEGEEVLQNSLDRV